ncbi:ATP-binding protein [Fluviicola taffensis]|uniref:histidine kinase n=1 Tax=Fluviicola taffensis (strain DSM 16823 / NCIMB 13979 / RW262) TaxID=755732 RepID=F2IHD7_FLUTR|nr:ATP-binding protein [Fluviicola taffensis]AEA42692.1 integral membrane sensor signal transduction histidine kinase [Fluviicola taffensis DSM 16823]
MSGLIVLVIVAYLAMLFFVAYRIDASTRLRLRVANSPTIYALSLAVYCTAWTFFGSVGGASAYNIQFLTIYIGPVILMPFLWFIYRKFIRISRAQGISSLSDFIANRYDKSIGLNRLVAILLMLGIIPYIALQITGIDKAIETIVTNNGTEQNDWLSYVDTSFLVTLGLGYFIIIFTTKRFQEKEQNTGLVGAIALESIVKLIVFLFFGVYIVLYASDKPQLFADFDASKLKLNPNNDYGQWFGMIFLSALAFLFLPRQFELGVVTAANERKVKRAIWMFPIYLLLINLFVIPIAIVGNNMFAGHKMNPDMYMLSIPIHLNNGWMALLVLLGGFSAASGMIIVATHALSKMVSNAILMPSFINNRFVLNRFKDRNHKIPVFFRRLSIFVVLLLAYLYHKLVVADFTLISIGLVSFVAVAQFSPAILGGIFWKLGNKYGAIIGISLGFSVWLIFLIGPTILNLNVHGVFGTGHHSIRPEGDLITTVLFWSLLLNTLGYIAGSILTKQTALEQNQATLYVDIMNYSTEVDSGVVWKGTAFFPDIKSLLSRFLGERRVTAELNHFAQKQGINLEDQDELDSRLIGYSEKMLSPIVGASSAKILISSVVKEEKLSMEDVVNILEESQKIIAVNKELQQRTDELKRVSEALKLANFRMKENDLLKDEFLYTVTHEMRTPLTSIKALSELLSDEEDAMPEEIKKEFLNTILKESNRMTRLISQVLDLENFESGKHQLIIDKVDISELMQHCLQSLDGVFKQNNIQVCIDIEENLPDLEADHDRITQVVLNLLANAAKYCDKESGKVWVDISRIGSLLQVKIADNGPGVIPELREIIFEKFFQAKNQTMRKPKGSGLGLAISKKIIQLHEGKIGVNTNDPEGSVFTFSIPFTQNRD